MEYDLSEEIDTTTAEGYCDPRVMDLWDRYWMLPAEAREKVFGCSSCRGCTFSAEEGLPCEHDLKEYFNEPR